MYFDECTQKWVFSFLPQLPVCLWNNHALSWALGPQIERVRVSVCVFVAGGGGGGGRLGGERNGPLPFETLERSLEVAPALGLESLRSPPTCYHDLLGLAMLSCRQVI